MPTTSSAELIASDLRVPMPNVVQFVRQLSHDLRNQLNAAELQSAYMKEIAADAEMKEEVQRLRAILGEMSSALQKLSTSLIIPKLTEMPYEAAAFLEDLQHKARTQFADKANELEWQVQLSDEMISIDPQILQQAILELVGNAFQHGRGEGKIQIAARANGELRITITEPKSDFAESTGEWGRDPLGKVKHGHYGLGLHRARNIIEAHRGQLEAQHDSASGMLITQVVLPLVRQS